jgi:hypothetical protein
MDIRGQGTFDTGASESCSSVTRGCLLLLGSTDWSRYGMSLMTLGPVLPAAESGETFCICCYRLRAMALRLFTSSTVNFLGSLPRILAFIESNDDG